MRWNSGSVDLGIFSETSLLEGIINMDETLEVRPAQYSPQCGDNLAVLEKFREPDKVLEVLVGKAVAA